MKKTKLWLFAGVVFFVVYFFTAARPIPLETVLIPRWLTSLETGNPIILGDNPVGENSIMESNSLMPFELGSRFGYFDYDGHFPINRPRTGNVAISAERWAEYNAQPDRITFNSSSGETLAVTEDPRGYPFFLDGRAFLIGSEQNAVMHINDDGSIGWTYEFSSPLTCIDAAAGLVLTGSLGGVATVVDSNGRQIFSFEPGGSSYSVIVGCAISRDGSRLALISGVNPQRFLVLERFGNNEYRVVYHEFLDSDFRRAVNIFFIEDDRWIVFEREGGLGFFEVGSRHTSKTALNGELSAIDHAGGQRLLFVIVSHPGNARELVGIRLPGRVFMQGFFSSDDVFLQRSDSRLFIGGRQALISFDVEKR